MKNKEKSTGLENLMYITPEQYKKDIKDAETYAFERGFFSGAEFKIDYRLLIVTEGQSQEYRKALRAALNEALKSLDKPKTGPEEPAS